MGENSLKPCKEVCNVPDEILKQLQEDVGEIKAALLGNQYNGKGLIQKQNDIDAELKALKKKHEEDTYAISSRLDKINWTAGGISTGVSMLLGIILFILKLIGKL